jgi:CheY-like chemotaxis protein
MAATVMVVEDDGCIREMLIEILGGEGLVAVGARNGAEALERLRRERLRPALILLDLMMPVMDGWQFRVEQLGDPSLARIPVVVMSASDDDREVPADGRVRKPFDIDTLLRVVSRFTAPLCGVEVAVRSGAALTVRRTRGTASSVMRRGCGTRG